MHAVRNGQCDDIDSMLGTGYIPKPDSLAKPCRYGDLNMVTRLLKCGFLSALEYGQVHLLNHLF